MDHKQLEVWKKSVDLVTKIYLVTDSFPEKEKFGLTNQMRRAAVSIPSNIAEGHSRKAKDDFARFLRIALGSCSELETQLIISSNLKLVEKNSLDPLLDCCVVIQKMLRKLISSLVT